MADQTLVVREPDILALIVNPIGFHRAFGTWLVVDDEGALDVDFDGTGIGDGLLEAAGTCVGGLGGGPGAPGALIGGNRGGHDGRCLFSCEFTLKLAQSPCRRNGGVPRLTAYISFCPGERERIILIIIMNVLRTEDI